MTPYPVIVIDGPDCSGKTTLANSIIEHFGGKEKVAYIHATYRFRTKMDVYHRAIYERAMKLAQKMPVIIDRWWSSEIVYAKAFRGRTSWPKNARIFDRLARRAGFMYIFALPEDAEKYHEAWNAERERRYAEKPWALKGRDNGNDDQLGVYYLYWQLMYWIDYRQRDDVFIYDRFDVEGMSDTTRKTWFKEALKFHYLTWDLWNIGDGLETRVPIIMDCSADYGKRNTPAGARCSDEQRAIDQWLTKRGVPEHTVHFMSINEANEYDLGMFKGGVIAGVMNQAHYGAMLIRLNNSFANIQWMTPLYAITDGHVLNSLGNKDIIDAAHQLGLD